MSTTTIYEKLIELEAKLSAVEQQVSALAALPQQILDTRQLLSDVQALCLNIERRIG